MFFLWGEGLTDPFPHLSYVRLWILSVADLYVHVNNLLDVDFTRQKRTFANWWHDSKIFKDTKKGDGWARLVGLGRSVYSR